MTSGHVLFGEDLFIASEEEEQDAFVGLQLLPEQKVVAASTKEENSRFTIWPMIIYEMDLAPSGNDRTITTEEAESIDFFYAAWKNKPVRWV